MKIQPIRKVNQKFRSYAFKNFADCRKKAIDVIAYKDKLYTGIKLKYFQVNQPEGHSVVHSFIANRNIYLQYSNNTLYTLVNNVLRPITEVGSEMAIVLDIPYQGRSKLLIIKGDGKAFFAEDTDSLFNFPPAISAVCYGGRLFLADKKQIYFGKFLDYTNFSEYGSITVDSTAGEILGLYVYQRELIVFCQYKIYALTCSGKIEGYTLNEVGCLKNSIRENSIYKTCDGCIFTAGNKIYVYKDKSVRELVDLLEFNFIYNNYAFDGENYYIEVMSADNEKYICVYSLLYDCICFTGCDNKVLVAGGYLCENDGQFIKLNDPNGNNGNLKQYQTKLMNLDNPKKKRIVEICLYSSSAVALSVKGDFGVKEMEVVKGYNTIKCNLLSNAFEFLIKSDAEEIYISDVQVKFMVKGD